MPAPSHGYVRTATIRHRAADSLLSRQWLDAASDAGPHGWYRRFSQAVRRFHVARAFVTIAGRLQRTVT